MTLEHNLIPVQEEGGGETLQLGRQPVSLSVAWEKNRGLGPESHPSGFTVLSWIN